MVGSWRVVDNKEEHLDDGLLVARARPTLFHRSILFPDDIGTDAVVE